MFRGLVTVAIIVHALVVCLILYQLKSNKPWPYDCIQSSSMNHFESLPQRRETRYYITAHQQQGTFEEKEVTAGVIGHSGHQGCQTGRPFIILVTANIEFLPLFFNWIESLSRLALICNVTLAPEDHLVTDYMLRHPVRMLNILATDAVQMVNNGIHVDQRKRYKGRYDYLNMINRRMSYMLTLLKSGNDVLLADTDAVWLQNPLPIVKGTYSQFDVWIATGKKNMPCPCFMYVKSEVKTIDLVERWIQTMQSSRKKLTDQESLSKVLYDTDKSVNVRHLDINQFPTGMEFFDKSWNNLHKGDVVVAHGNHLGRFRNKMNKFKEFNIWFNNSTEDSFWSNI